MHPPSCGIDFGTSNSTVALADGQGARLIDLEGGQPTLPSAVFWDSEGAPPLFGRAAIAAYVEGEDGRLMRGLKSTLGSSLIREQTRVGNRAMPFVDIVGAFFGHMRARLDAVSPGITRVVLGRPVHFVDDDAEADAAAEAVLRQIAEAQGFRDIAFQFEPIAAALHYEQATTAEELVLIVDIGGGTSDFSIVRVSPDRARKPDRQDDILANDGIRVGGTDFDRLLSLRQIMPHLGFNSRSLNGKSLMPRHYFLDLATWHRINAPYGPRTLSDLRDLRRTAEKPELLDRMIRVVTNRTGHSLAMAAEATKVELSSEETSILRIGRIIGGPSVRVPRAAFEQAVEAPVGRIGTMLDEVLRQAGLSSEDITTVFMTGGSSSLPVLRGIVAAAFPHASLAAGDLLGSVGTGLALEARRRFG